MLRHIPLSEEDAACRIKPGCQKDRRRVVGAFTQLHRIVGNRRRVQIHDAVERFAPVLTLNVLVNRADQVAEVLSARRLNA